MSKFFTMLTQIGEAKFANATALGSTVKLEKLAVGDGGGTLPTPNQTQTALVNEVRRDMLNTIKVDQENANWIICEQVLPEDVGGWTIREVGLYDADGDLVAVGNFPETYKPVLQEGAGRTQTIQVVLQVSASSSVELKIDPSIVLATRECVDSKTSLLERKDNFATNADIDSESISAKHIKLPQLWRVFTNKVKQASITTAGIVQLSNYVTENDETKAASARAVYNLNEKVNLCFSPDNPSPDLRRTPFNVTGSRAAGVEYTNTSDVEIIVSISGYTGGPLKYAFVDNVPVGLFTTHGGVTGRTNVTLVVKPGSKYKTDPGVYFEVWSESL